ncbi:uncharacterized protein LOC126606061 [Malus sylvestris]|uniref:uncharacterized protein LOC126606061 n=1 Tax=Malus sylvestris TaxID=3752 RepID=UPI0021AC4FE8|nr:uncharacterized protein LOC126606061 [Malus sylvestris]
MIAFHFPEDKNTENTMLHNIQRNHSFIVQVGQETLRSQNLDPHHQPPKLNLSAMKIFNRFRKIIMKLIFTVPSRSARGTSPSGATSTSRQRNSSCDRFEPPKTSCSSYYSSHLHYNEAIADCIEFFNKSSSGQEGSLDDGEFNVMV